jgi:hypothetical protein
MAQFQLGHKKTGGRKRGTPNKTTSATKRVIAEVAERLGGADRLYEWSREDAENERSFWVTIYPKLLPLDIEAGVSGDIRVTFVKPEYNDE